MTEMINTPRFREPKIVDRLEDRPRHDNTASLWPTPELSDIYDTEPCFPSFFYDCINRSIRNPVHTIQHAIGLKQFSKRVLVYNFQKQKPND